ncbi:MAG TPA: alpha/beta hydrolase [Euzebyales bacterium]|nr:alpha/beta hydrolase [Euzebyales bacterium]
MGDSQPQGRIRLRRDGQQWEFDRVVKETGKVFHFQPPGRGGLPSSVRMHAMISKHVGKVGERLERLAAEEAAAGHDATALDLYFDAALAYAEAQHTIFVNNDEKRYLHGSSIRCYDEVRARAPYTIEHVDVPWEDTVVSGNLHLAPVDGPAPCVFFIPGCDMTKEMAPHPHYNHALQRGMHVFVFDGPGQGESNLRDIALTTDNYEAAASAALTYLLDRPEIDADRVGVLALSFGSYWGARFAATDHRLAAAALPWASICDKYYLMEEESPRYKQLFAYLTRAKSEEDLDAFVAGMGLEHLLPEIACPTLLQVGEYDPRSPLEEVYDLYQRMRAPRELWVFADQHHMATLRGAANMASLWNLDAYATAMDFLADRFQGRPLAHDGEVLYLEPGGGGPAGATVTTNHHWFET